jgi:hypothetical protein
MRNISDFIDAKTAGLKDERLTRGEAIVLHVKPNVEQKAAVKFVIEDLIKFFGNATGKMYAYHKEAYSNSYRVEEPGRPSYGVRVTDEPGKIIINPVAVLLDADILRRYVQRIRRLGALEEQENKDTAK